MSLWRWKLTTKTMSSTTKASPIPGAGANQTSPGSRSREHEDGFMTSLAALKQIILLDTPTKSVLKGPTPADQRQRQLQEQIRSLRDSVATKDARLTSFSDELKESAEKLEQERVARVALERIVEEKLDLEKEIQILRQQKSDMNKEATELQITLQSEKEDSACEVQNLEDRLRHMAHERLEALEQSDAMDARRLTSERRAEELAKEKKIAMELLNQERFKLEEAIGSLERTVKSLQERGDRAESSRAKLVVDLGMKSTALDETKTELETTKIELREAKEELKLGDSVKRKLEESNSSVSLLEKKAARLEEDIVSEKSLVTALREKIEKQQSLSESTLQAEKEKFEEQRTKAIDDLKEVFDEKERDYASTLDELKSNLRDSRTTLEAKERLLVSKEKMTQLLKSKNASLEKEVDELKVQAEKSQNAADEEMGNLRTRLAEIEVEHRRAEGASASEMKEKNDQLAEKDRLVKSLEAAGENSKAQRESGMKEVAELRQKVDGLDSDLTVLVKLRSDLYASREELHTKSQELSDRDDIVKDLQTKNSLAEAKLVDFQQQLDELTRGHPDKPTLDDNARADTVDHATEPASADGVLRSPKQDEMIKTELVSKLQNQIESVEQEKSDLGRQVEELTELLKLAHATNSSRNEKEAKLATDIESLTNALDAKKTDKGSDLVKLESESAERELGEMRNRLEEASTTAAREAADFHSKLKAVEEELVEVKDELECAEQEVARCRTRLAQFEADLEKSHAASQVKDEEICRLREASAYVRPDGETVIEQDNIGAPQPNSLLDQDTLVDDVGVDSRGDDRKGDVLATKKRPADELPAGNQQATSELDSLKARLLAKKKQRKETD